MPASPELKARVVAAVQAHRDEILALSHAIHADPEPAFEEVRAARRCADAVGAHGFAVQHPAGRLATAVRATLPGGRGSDGARIGILAEYDALPGLGHGCGHNTMAAQGVGAAHRPGGRARRLRRRGRLPRNARRGAGERQAVHARRRALRRARRGAALPPERSHPGELLPPRQRGHRRHVHRPPGPRRVGAVDGPERARRADPAPGRRSGCGASSCHTTRGSTGSCSRVARPPTSSRASPAAGS